MTVLDQQLSEELVRGDVRVCLEYIGEGRNGDYDAVNPADIPLLRFCVDRRAGELWEGVEDANYCTQLPATISPEARRAALEYLMDEVFEAVASGQSVKRLCERLSWVDEDTVRAGSPRARSVGARA